LAAAILDLPPKVECLVVHRGIRTSAGRHRFRRGSNAAAMGGRVNLVWWPRANRRGV